jgi:hypothetical protein
MSLFRELIQKRVHTYHLPVLRHTHARIWPDWGKVWEIFSRMAGKSRFYIETSSENGRNRQHKVAFSSPIISNARITFRLDDLISWFNFVERYPPGYCILFVQRISSPLHGSILIAREDYLCFLGFFKFPLHRERSCVLCVVDGSQWHKKVIINNNGLLYFLGGRRPKFESTRW